MENQKIKKIKLSHCDEYRQIEWSKEKTLEFIQDYRHYTVLWSSSLKSFNRVQRLNAIEELANKYDCNVEFIRNKIKSLRSSFHREYTKYRKRQRKDSVNIQEPSWFAYEHMKFIISHIENYDNCGDGQNYNETSMHDSVNDAISEGFVNYDCLELKTGEINSTTNDILDTKNEIQKIVDERNQEDDKGYGGFNFYNNERDKFQVFGEHVALTLKRLKSEKAEIIAKHLINNILFEAEMGKFDNGLTSSESKNVN